MHTVRIAYRKSSLISSTLSDLTAVVVVTVERSQEHWSMRKCNVFSLFFLKKGHALLGRVEPP